MSRKYTRNVEADLSVLARIIDDGSDDYQPFYDRHGKCISSDIACAILAAGFRRAPGEPTVATKPAIGEVRKYIESLEDWEAQPHVLEELLSALDDIPDCETWTAVPHEEHVPAEPAVQGDDYEAGKEGNHDE